ncbi:MAG TPA: S1/P1 nuclease [Pyrinomonadaceae bacterium]|nr:S1/P1 nuclease [Pyrinomonadaceae bacterium]
MTNKNICTSSRRGMALGVLLLILWTPSISLGWGAGGHMMTASIAFRRLNPRAKAQAQALLAIPIEPSSVCPPTWCVDFVHASHWADDLRPFPEFDHFKPRHFIDQPFSMDGTPVPAYLADPDNIVKALGDNVEILKTSTDKKAQAQALRFIIHFVGDIHQPLHAAVRIDRDHPDGDRGGNLVKIKVGGKDTNLHSYWDGGIGSFPKSGPNFAPPPLSEIGPAAAKATAGNPATDPKLKLKKPFDYQGWANESFVLAKDVAYQGMTNGVEPTPAYNSKALMVARRRVAWGGYRLAALLNAIWP